MASEAQLKSAKKYLQEKVEDIRIRVPKGQKEVIQNYASSVGMSVNAFIVQAINEKMESSPLTEK